MTDAEYKREYWDNEPHSPVYVIELDNGCQIFASRDYEGNGGGALFGIDAQEKQFTILESPTQLHPQPTDTSTRNDEGFGFYIKNNFKP